MRKQHDDLPQWQRDVLQWHRWRVVRELAIGVVVTVLLGLPCCAGVF